MRFLLLLSWALAASLQAATLRLVNTPVQMQVFEVAVAGLPAVANPFDPVQADLTSLWTAPSGTNKTIHGFWFQDYRRTLSNGREVLSTQGTPEWRIRFAAEEAGEYKVDIRFNGTQQLTTNITFASSPPNGFVQVSTNKQHLAVLGEPLLLNGANVCWHDARGTFDYSDWFPKMAQAKENFARLWMSPWAFGIEAEKGTLNKYKLDRAWTLDFVFNLAKTNGIYLMLCLEYHGMFETEPDFWGANNNWTNNPYATFNGGPASSPNDFFVNATAKTIYQKRLRYLIARYGAYPNLLAWQFFNEIDNVYRNLNATSVAQWHKQMGAWVKTNDPNRHLVTTSLTSLSNRPEIWNLPEMDFTMYHSYGLPDPATSLSSVLNSMRNTYRKPVMHGEYGTDFRGWMRTENDPYLRGWRQGIWAGLMSGSVGTGMSWWWQDIHRENLYPVYSNVSHFISRMTPGIGATRTITFQTSGNPPTTVGDQIPNGTPFTATLTPNGTWGWKGTGRLALVNSDAASKAGATFNAFIHGSAHADLKNPFVISAWNGENAKMTIHLNSVSAGATMAVRVNGQEIFRRALPNKDGGTQVNNEYNEDIVVPLTAGKNSIEIFNPATDWFYIDWVRIEQVLPPNYLNNWQPSPVAIGQRGDVESWLYIINPAVHYPAGAKLATPPPVPDRNITLTQWPAGKFYVLWYDGRTGAFAGTSDGETVNGLLRLMLPEFSEDLVGRLSGEQRVRIEKTDSGAEVRSDPYRKAVSLQISPDLQTWFSGNTDPQEGLVKFFRTVELP